MKSNFSFLAFGALLLTTAWTAPTPFEADNLDTVSEVRAKPGVGNFSFFRVHRQGKGITATWGLNNAQGIIGFQLQKTYEDPNDEYAIWEDVCSTPFTGARSYKFTDNNVFPGNINYRVIALSADGNNKSSGIATARIVSR